MTARFVASRTPDFGSDAFGVRDRRTGVVRVAGISRSLAKAVARGWNRGARPPRRVRVGGWLFAGVLLVLAVWLVLGIARDAMSEPTRIERSPVEVEVRDLMVALGGYEMFCRDVVFYGGIESYISGEGGSGTPFAEDGWPEALRAIHAAECRGP